MQAFFPEIKGERKHIEFVRSWSARVDGGNLHIGLMADGNYAIVPNGFSITERQMIKDCIPPGLHREKALYWFDHYDKPDNLSLVRKLYYEGEDDTWRYVDTQEVVENVDDLVDNLKGQVLDAAKAWFSTYHQVNPIDEPDEPETLPSTPDDYIIKALMEQPGLTTDLLYRQLQMRPSEMLRRTQALEAAGRIVREGKGWLAVSLVRQGEHTYGASTGEDDA